MTEEQEIIKQAFKDCGFKEEKDVTKEEVESELEHVNDVYETHKGLIEDYNNRIELLKVTHDNKVQEFKDKIREIEEMDDNNYMYRDHRQQILRQIEVIEYQKLNPDLDVS